MTPYDLPQLTDLPLAEIAGVRQHVRREMQQRLQANLFPYEGEWLAREELDARLRARRRRAWGQAVELLVLCAALGGIGVLLVLLLQWFTD
ncbi:MAG TPA: hypothetical protein VFP36_06675 [Usitatibacter sp.]|nr:hypothetical protein [Usitatibacter sp.]